MSSLYPPLYSGATSGVSGIAGLVPPAAAGDQLKLLRGDGTWATGSSGTPGGSSGDIQYNNSGAFGGFTPAAGVQTFLTTPTSANLAAAVTNETGTGALVFAGTPTLVTPILGTPTSGTLTNCTGLPAANILSGALASGMTATTQSIADNSTKLATTAYVDASVADDINVKNPVVVATNTALLFSPSYSNGTSGVGATLTGGIGVLVVDGYTPVLNDRILAKNESSTLTNGVYTLTRLGTIGIGYILTRATDFNQAANVLYGDTVGVLQGTVNANQQFTMNNQNAITVGTTAITFAQTSGGSQLTSGNGITITGNSVAINTAVTADLTTAQTLSSKRLTPRVTTITSNATPTVNTDNCDVVTITAQTAAITSMTTNLTGTPTNFDLLSFRIKDDGTARAITWGASFVAGGTALPTTTTVSKTLRVWFEYDSVITKWVCVGSASDA